MSWALAQREVRCDRCPHVVQVGEPARFGDTSPTVWCAHCAKVCLLEDAPSVADLAASAAPAAEPQPDMFEDVRPEDRRFKSYDARQSFEELRQAVREQDAEGRR